MFSRSKFIAAMLLASPLVGLGLPTAKAASPDAAIAAEQLCDYCGDYSDAATSAGKVRTAYQVGVGYAAIAGDRTAASVAAKQDQIGLQLLTLRSN